MRNASLEDCQLLAESEILQRDLFVAAKDQKDHPKKREDCVQHEAGSVSASSLKINRLRGRWDLARHRADSGLDTDHDVSFLIARVFRTDSSRVRTNRWMGCRMR